MDSSREERYAFIKKFEGTSKNNNNIGTLNYEAANFTEDELQEIYINGKNNSTKEQKYEQSKLKKKVIGTVLIASMSFYLGMTAVISFQINKGKEILANEFYKYTEGYSIVKMENGYSAATKHGLVNLDSTMIEIVDKALNGGMTKPELKVAIKKVYPGLENEYYGLKEISKEEVNEAAKAAYHQSKIEEKGTGVTRK